MSIASNNKRVIIKNWVFLLNYGIENGEVPGHDAIAISQDGNEPAYYIIKIEDGKIVKGDLTAFLM